MFFKRLLVKVKDGFPKITFDKWGIVGHCCYLFCVALQVYFIITVPHNFSLNSFVAGMLLPQWAGWMFGHFWYKRRRKRLQRLEAQTNAMLADFHQKVGLALAQSESSHKH